jgi:Ca2+-binding RTX toxin-like protein
VNSSSATFVFSSTEPDSAFECALDGATFNSCASPQDYAGLSDGPHTFRVRATDAAGNTDPTPAELSWTVGSTTLEAPAIASPADNSYNNTGNITVSGTAEPGNTVELFDGAASVGVVTTNASGDWSKELGGVTEGSHTYTAKTTDAAGNTSAASNGRTIIVDTTPPETAIDSGPSGTSNSASATFAFSSTEPNSRFECALDGASFNSCTSPKDYANLSAGSHAFEVRATDVAGNTDPTPASRTWTVGTPPAPGCTITGTANAETLTGTSADDVICAGGGNDTVNGLGGNDTLKGEAGGDTLLGGVGDDTLDGGLGTDTASYSASPTAVTASLATNSATGEGSDTLLGVENLIGSSSADTLTGSDAINRLAGGDGDDTERGGLGNDTVQGNGGADTLDGGDGDDTVNSKDGVNGNDSLDGGAGTDTQVSDATEKSVVGFP